MNTLPKDPLLLYGYINMKLRDEYPSLNALCEDLNVEKEYIDKILNAAGFFYDEKANKYI